MGRKIFKMLTIALIVGTIFSPFLEMNLQLTMYLLPKSRTNKNDLMVCRGTYNETV